MLDENLPTYRFRQSPDSPTDTLLHYTSSGSDPSPAFLIRRPSPSSSRARYAAALADPSLPSIIYAETLVIPDWHTSAAPSDPSSRNGSPPREPVTPSTLTLTLYNPDQSVTLKHSPSGWNRSESWDFDLPTRTFRVPSSSQLDRSETSPAQDASVPKISFKWKKDGRMSRDMTCYMVGRSEDGRRSKEPDITVALFSQGRESCAVTLYEPNMRRVEIEDRKGLEVVLLLGAEAIRSLYLNGHKGDPFNLSAGGKRRESRPSRPLGVPAAASASMEPTMTSAIAAPKQKTGDREKKDREEQERIRRMLEEEEARERRKRDAEVEAETERLRKLYGVPGSQPQQPQTGPGRPPLPPRPGGNSPTTLTAPTMPPRPVSAGPYAHGAQGYGYAPGQGPPRPAQGPAQGQGHGHGHASAGKKKVESIVSGFFRGEREREKEREEEKRKKVQKKRSVHF